MRRAEVQQGPAPGWQQGQRAAGMAPQPRRHTSEDLYAAAVLTQQRALASERATAELMRKRLALEQHNVGYAWSLNHLAQHQQAMNSLAYNQNPIVVGPDGSRSWSGVTATPARHEPVTPYDYNRISAVPAGWEF